MTEDAAKGKSLSQSSGVSDWLLYEAADRATINFPFFMLYALQQDCTWPVKRLKSWPSLDLTCDFNPFTTQVRLYSSAM